MVTKGWLLCVTVMCAGMAAAQGDVDDESELGGNSLVDSTGGLGDSAGSAGDGGGGSVSEGGNSLGESGSHGAISASPGSGDGTGHASSDPPDHNSSMPGAGYGFYRTMGPHGRWVDTRRVFGGAAAKLEDFPRMCALLDRFLGARCSGSIVSPRWVLTAAHCISPNLAYVKYNTRHPLRTSDGQIVAIQYLYKHPEFKVKQEDLGRGMDVTLLHHDVGLVRTRADMLLTLRSDTEPLHAMATLNAETLRDQEVQVLGYGRTETAAQGEELLEARLRLVNCDRPTWTHCVCGVSSRGASSGVCSGDSGGPVVYKGVQVGVTSMGPLECARENASWPGRATSVFTSLYQYTDIINRTILDAEESMQRLSKATSQLHAPLAAALALVAGATSLLLTI